MQSIPKLDWHIFCLCLFIDPLFFPTRNDSKWKLGTCVFQFSLRFISNFLLRLGSRIRKFHNKIGCIRVEIVIVQGVMISLLELWNDGNALSMRFWMWHNRFYAYWFDGLNLCSNRLDSFDLLTKIEVMN